MPSAVAVVGATVLVGQPPSADAATGLKVLDWNVEGGASAEGGARWNQVVDTIAAADADVVTLQEVLDAAGLDVDGDGEANGISQCASAGNLVLTRYPIAEQVRYRLPNDSGCEDDDPHAVHRRPQRDTREG